MMGPPSGLAVTEPCNKLDLLMDIAAFSEAYNSAGNALNQSINGHITDIRTKMRRKPSTIRDFRAILSS